MMHLTPTIRCCTIVCGQEGVAAPVILPSHLKSWYLLGEESAPHVTLAVGHGFEARSLGPMIRRASKLQWEPTQTPGITKATTENMWRFMTVDTEEHCLPERLTLPRHHEISGEGAGLSKSHRDSILHHPRPITVSGMLSFLGLTGYSRTHIPDYTSRTEPLREIVREAGPRNLHSSLTWTPEASTAFALLKTDLSMVLQTQPARTELTDQHIKELQFTAGPYEHSVWGQMGATKGPDELWRCHDGRLVAPANLCPELIREAHGPTHEGKLKTLQK
ncbi:unnamed protein product, partial [Coregonus sp. 'balchen']